MENFELIISAPPKRKNNWFPKGHKPFNKGIPMKQWMDGRKIKKVMKYLELGRKAGNPDLPGKNKIPIVGIKDGKLYPFKCASDAEKILRQKGIKVNQRNIRAVCEGKLQRQKYYGKVYFFVRKKAGGFQWFRANEPEKYKNLLTN